MPCPRATTGARIAIFAYEELRDARRYDDVLLGRGYAMMSSLLESHLHIEGMERSHVVTLTAKDIEVLAGTGDLRHARELAERLLAFAHTPETREVLQTSLARAGQPGLLAAPAK
jgi:hypothetical protein